jgi:hypothetical protein
VSVFLIAFMINLRKRSEKFWSDTIFGVFSLGRIKRSDY